MLWHILVETALYPALTLSSAVANCCNRYLTSQRAYVMLFFVKYSIDNIRCIPGRLPPQEAQHVTCLIYPSALLFSLSYHLLYLFPSLFSFLHLYLLFPPLHLSCVFSLYFLSICSSRRDSGQRALGLSSCVRQASTGRNGRVRDEKRCQGMVDLGRYGTVHTLYVICYML